MISFLQHVELVPLGRVQRGQQRSSFATWRPIVSSITRLPASVARSACRDGRWIGTPLDQAGAFEAVEAISHAAGRDRSGFGSLRPDGMYGARGASASPARRTARLRPLRQTAGSPYRAPPARPRPADDRTQHQQGRKVGRSRAHCSTAISARSISRPVLIDTVADRSRQVDLSTKYLASDTLYVITQW